MKVRVTVTMDLEVEAEDERGYDMTHAEVTKRVKEEATQFLKDFPELLSDNQDIYVIKRNGAAIVE